MWCFCVVVTSTVRLFFVFYVYAVCSEYEGVRVCVSRISRTIDICQYSAVKQYLFFAFNHLVTSPQYVFHNCYTGLSLTYTDMTWYDMTWLTLYNFTWLSGRTMLCSAIISCMTWPDRLDLNSIIPTRLIFTNAHLLTSAWLDVT